MRLTPIDIHQQYIGQATVYDWSGPVPRFNSIDNALILSAVQRSAGYWRVWLVDDIRGRFARWWSSRKVVPTFAYPLDRETGIIFHRAVVQRYGLAIRETVAEARQWKPDAIAGIEILAYATSTADLCRVFYHDRTSPDGFDGFNPHVRAGRTSKRYTPAKTPELLRAAQLMHDHFRAHFGHTLTIEKAGYLWTRSFNTKGI